MPPVSHRLHRHYEHKGWHLAIDTLLALAIYFLAIWSVFLLTRSEFVPAPTLRFDIAGLPTAGSNDQYTINLRMENAGNVEVSDIEISLTPPQRWQLERAGENLTSLDDTKWSVPALAPDARFESSLIGEVWGNVGEQAPFEILVRYTASGEQLAVTDTLSTTIEKPAAQLTEFNVPATVTVGQQFTVEAIVELVSEQALTGSAVQLLLPADARCVSDSASDCLLPLTDLSAERPTQKLTWTVVATAARSDLVVTAQLLVAGPPEIDPYVQARDAVTLVSEPEKTIDEVVNEPAEENQEIEFVAEAHYFSTSGVQFGFGPLPPKVGQTTGYRVFWLIRNPGLTVDSAAVTATLPPGTEWAGNVSLTHGSGISYSPANRQVTWTIGTMESEMEVLTGSFDLTINPMPAMAGRPGQLLGESFFTGTGAGEGLNQADAALSTVIADSLARDKGIILP